MLGFIGLRASQPDLCCRFDGCREARRPFRCTKSNIAGHGHGWFDPDVEQFLLGKDLAALSLFYIAMGLFECGAAGLPYCSIVSRWFDKHRGLALGVMMLGFGCGALVMPALAQNLIARYGWRFTFGLVGAAILLFTVPIVAMFLKEKLKPAIPLAGNLSRGETARAGTCPDAGLSWHDAWHTSAFWLLLCAFVLVSASVHACFTHMAPILADRGSSRQVAAFAYPAKPNSTTSR